jgi:hypothetical protein
MKSKQRDSLKKYDSSISLLQFDKPIIYSKRRHSLGNFQQKLNINNFVLNFKVEANFIPKNRSNFILDLDTMSYLYHHKFYKHSSGNITKDVLLEKLIKESKEKISFLHNYEMFQNEQSITDKNEYSSSLSGSSSNSSSESSSSKSNLSYLSHVSISHKDQDEKLDHKHYNSFVSQKKAKSKEGLDKMHYYENKPTINSLLGTKKKSIKDPHLLDQYVNHIKEKSRKSIEYKFYESNLKNIRFMKYDFYKDMIVEVFDFDKTSKMFELMNEIKSNFNKMIHKEDDYPCVDINQIIHNKKKIKKETINKRNQFAKKLELDKILNNKEKQLNDIKLEKEKKIYETLNKKDKQHSIIKFLIISIFCLFLLYLICGVNIYLNLSIVSEDEENIRLIYESTDLKFYFYSAVYCVREMTLLNLKPIEGISNGVYEGYPTYNRTNYYEMVVDRILELYSLIHNLNEIIISTELPFSKNTTYYLNEKEFFLETITSDFEILTLRTGLSNAIISLDAFLYIIFIY